jgi:hypothetical protein
LRANRSTKLRSTCLALFMTLATLAAIEIALRVVDLRILREANSDRSLAYGYDAELGWAPIPNSSSSVTARRRFRLSSPNSERSRLTSGYIPVMIDEPWLTVSLPRARC